MIQRDVAIGFYDGDVLGDFVILRHGQSTWNQSNLFTGWHDVPLTLHGEAEATAAGVTMAQSGLVFDTSHTSVLTRAVITQHLALTAMEQVWLPVQRSWQLNERHYGTLQGLNKKATTDQHGAAQTKIWRRSFDVAPPPVDRQSSEHPANDRRYRHVAPSDLPASECLKDVVARVVPYFKEEVLPQLRAGMTVLLTAHGNSLRALVMMLENVSEDEISQLNIPTGVPRLYKLQDDLTVKSAQYLGDAAVIAAAVEAVAQQATSNPL
ncbi:MAG: 2,3-diphosphoglycerate-dependent phosphoglycerate mutase [Ilumatobacteraceae bacterium]|nr:2,3-diphosphoglycerate-dependent phosphoglycerate mutase [Ilumatobacteraceae bacterium]